jgi:hypothetical protein
VRLPGTLAGLGTGSRFAGARGGVYFTISANASEQTEILVADLRRGSAGYVTVQLPPEFAFLQDLYGVAMLDVDDADGGDALATTTLGALSSPALALFFRRRSIQTSNSVRGTNRSDALLMQ